MRNRIKMMLAILAACLMGVLSAEVNVSADMALQADTDWRGQGTVTIAEDATLDLNGHLLQVDAIAGAGRLTDSKCYELLEYVQSTGQQRVPTGYIPGADTMLEIDFLQDSIVGSAASTLYGTKTWSSFRYLCFVQNNNFYFFGSGKSVPCETGVRYRSVVRNGRMSLLRCSDSKIIGDVEANGTNTDGTDLRYFCNSNNNNPGNLKLYSSRVWHAKELRLDLVPARNAVTGAVGLFNRVNGTLLESETGTALIAGTATGATLSIGSLRVAATDGASLAGFTGTVDAQVRCVVDGTVQLSADADWSKFAECAIDGSVDLHGHDLKVASLDGVGSVTDSVSIYDRLEYVECNNQQRILTGITPGPDTAVELEMVFTQQSFARTCTILGCKTWSTYRYLMFRETNGNLYFFSNAHIACQPAINTRYRISVTPTTSPNGTFTVVNAATEQQVGSVAVDLTNSDNSQLALFSQSEELTRAGAFRLYSFKMTKGGNVVRDFIPVRNSKNGAVGLLDSVNDKFYASDSGVGLVAGPVATAAATHGRLRVAVPAGKTVTNAGLALGGSLSLVKEGAGTLSVMKEAQTYLGGTDIAAGELNIPDGGYVYHFIASYGYLGPTYGDVDGRCDIVVRSNAVFDIKGNNDYRLYTLTLDGGTVRNSGHAQGEGGGSLGTVTVTADSTLQAIRQMVFFDVAPNKLDLCGHTLAADIGDGKLFFRNHTVITNGTFSATGNGTLQFFTTLDARTAELRIACPLWVTGTAEVGDYYAACTANVNTGTAAMKVYGRFTPATDYFYGCTLQDGATLDLSARSGAWSTTSAFSSGLNRVTFAEGATITVDVHGRHPWTGKIVDWGEGNMPTNVGFRLDAQSKALRRALYVRDDGLYAASGVVVIVR